MANFNQLIRGSADALRRMQAEMAAAGKVPFPDAPGALSLYHGSPHPFDNFDFEGNLLRGEGAMAYGPGGYMTGNRPLAEHYANSLYRRQSGGSGIKLPSPFSSSEKAVYNMGSLNKYFLDTLGDRQMRLGYPDGQLVTMGPGQLARSKYSLSMDTSLDPWSGTVYTGGRSSGQFAPGQQKWVNSTGLSSMNNPHGTLSGMLNEDKNATLRYLQYKEAQRVLDSAFINQSSDPALRGTSAIPDAKAGSGWRHYLDTLDEISAESHNGMIPPASRMQGYGNNRWQAPDWRLTPRNSDWAMRMGEDLNNRLDPHANISMSVDRGQRRSPAAPGSGKAPYLYTADMNASPNDMLLYDAPFKDQASHVQGALNDLFSNGIQHSRLLDQTTGKIGPEAMGSDIIHSLPKDIDGMRMMKSAGVPATAFLRAGPRAGGMGLNFDPSDFNFVIHNQDLLDNVQRERIK